MKEKAIFSWSGGKDCATALYETLQKPNYEIAALLTTITGDYSRVSMHGVREVLLEMQAGSLGFALEKVFISKDSSDEEYESQMRAVLEKYKLLGVRSAVFGDIFLEDLRKHREDNLAEAGFKAVFPVWKRDTTELAYRFIDLGFKAVVTCADTEFLDKSFVGREFDKKFLTDLPSNVDPCGENGEFHSFVYNGPMFRKQIPHTIGEVVLRNNRFYYCDLIPS